MKFIRHLRNRVLVVAVLILFVPTLSFADDYALTKTFNADGKPHFPALNTQTNRLYVSDVTAGTVTMFNARTGKKLAETPTGAGAHTVMVDRKRNLVYVTNRGANTLSILDGKTNAKLADIPVGVAPHGLDLDTSGRRAYVSNTGSNDVTIVDTKNRTVIKTIPAGMGPWGVVWDKRNKLLYTSNTDEGTISRIDPKTGETLTKITVGGRPWNIKLSRKLNRIYASNEALGTLSVIQGDAVIAQIPVGAGPHGVIVDDRTRQAFVAATGANQVAIVDLTTNAVHQTVKVDQGPTALAHCNRDDAVYVANQAGGTISILNSTDTDE